MHKNKNLPPLIIIYSLSMTNYLIRCGHDLRKVEDNEKDSRFKAFFFQDTQKLRNDMFKYHREKVM